MPVIPTPHIQGSPPPISSEVFRDFTGGLNYGADDLQLKPNETVDCLDVILHARGGFRRRRGVYSLGVTGLDSTQYPRFLKHFPADDNGDIVVGGHTTGPTADKLAVWQNAAIVNDGARTALRTFTTASTLDANWSGALMKRVNGAAGEQILYIHRDYLSLVQAYSNAGTLGAEIADAYGNYNDNFAAPTNNHMPKASIACNHSNYMFHADTYENSIRRTARIRWSHPGQPGDYRTNDFIDVGEGQDNDTITALVSAQGRLFIFKSRSVWVLDGFSAETFAMTKIAEGIGCVNVNAAAASMDGVVFFDQHIGLQKITASNRTWNVVNLWQKLGRALQDGRMGVPRAACVAVAANRIYVSGIRWKGSPEPNRTWVTDALVSDGWWAMSVGFKLIAPWTDNAGTVYIMGAAPYTNEGGASALHYDYPTIYGYLSANSSDKLGASTVAYTGHLTTAWANGGDPSRKKRFRRFSCVFLNMAASSPFIVDAYRNWSVDVPPVRTFTIAGTGTPTSADYGQQINVRGGALGTAYSGAVKITGPNDVQWVFNQVTFRFVPKRIT